MDPEHVEDMLRAIDYTDLDDNDGDDCPLSPYRLQGFQEYEKLFKFRFSLWKDKKKDEIRFTESPEKHLRYQMGILSNVLGLYGNIDFVKKEKEKNERLKKNMSAFGTFMRTQTKKAELNIIKAMDIAN